MRRICGILGVLLLVVLVAQPAVGEEYEIIRSDMQYDEGGILTSYHEKGVRVDGEEYNLSRSNLQYTKFDVLIGYKEKGRVGDEEYEIIRSDMQYDEGGRLTSYKDVEPLVITFPVTPVVDAYVFMAVDAHDRYQDLDAAHDWLDRALELDPNNPVAARLLDQVKAEEQQVGLQRAGVALGALQQMMIRMAEEEEHRMHEERHEGEGAPAEEPGPPPEEGH